MAQTVRLPDSPDVNRSWRRISTGKLSFLYNEEKILPNHLRSSSGSCHDVCKYGRKQEPEYKPRVSPLKRVNRSFSGTLSFDSPLRKKALTKSVLSSSFGSGRYDSGSGSDHGMRQVRNFSSGCCDVKKQNAERTKIKAATFSDSTKRKKTVSHSFKTIGVSRRRALEMVEQNKRVTALKLKSVAQTAAMALRRSTVNINKTNGGSKAAGPKKSVWPLRATMSSRRYSQSLKAKESNGGSKAAEPKKAAVVPLRAKMSSKRYSRSVKANKESNVPLNKTRKMVDETCKDLVEEKTLYVIKMETGDETVESDENQRCVMDSPKSQDEAECIVTEADDESSQEEEEEEEEEEQDENTSLSEDKNTTRQGKNKALSTESSLNGKSMRLRFKRGKIVDVVGSQNNSPRKLKFKRGKIVTGADTTTKSSGRRRLKTKGTNFSNDKEQQHTPRSLKIVLKHQETQKKRDSRVLLFNNVIEETANKLVETRKSKVKALVGAFESVISLQEKNFSPTA